ncbi:MAG: T9SS type A sorting domain-containing protein [Flavobacteriales bacterium]|nr:T9SS type A sorting domain-containing protein [Flavobacteriales bacterium]
MKKLILYLCFCFIIPVGHAQIYFNRDIDHFSAPWESGIGIVSDSGNYFINYMVYGHGATNGYGLMKLDSFGNTLFDRFYPLNGYRAFSGLSGCFIRTVGGNLVGCGDLTDTITGESFGYIYGYNHQGDTLFTRLISDSITLYNIAPTSDSGFICTGVQLVGNENIVAIKYDRYGNLEWSNHYGGTTVQIAATVKELSTGSFLISGTGYGICGTKQHLVIKISSQGAFIWQKCYPAAFPEGGIGLSDELPDGNFLISGARNYSNFDYRPYLAKIDSLDGTIIWEKVYADPSDGSGSFGPMLISDDNSIISVVGHFYDLSIYKLTPSGDSIWRRDGISPSQQAAGYFWSMTLVNGNELVGTGQTEPFLGIRNVWVMKFDQHGCDTICWPPGPMGGLEFNVADSITSGITDRDNDYPIKAFPNPADDQLWIELPPDLLSAIVSLEIYSLDGAKKYSEKLPASHLKFPVSLSGLTNGIYFLKISDSSKTYYYKKLVVMH